MAFRFLLPLTAAALLAGCASSAIAPKYATDNPDIMRIGNERPANPEVQVENLGSYCVEVRETWNEHGKTPDGQILWAKDTSRKVVPCD
ncbi:hypothetical protein GCM10007160_37940 [Litchfieldella qijiaojingensis]|uniref:Lipoprotein n=1 Tax=Litchfieldella qijiaojingensis TaxID=980347 RepID=A0ABQ2Z787_9GAMM|nr:hypothetical protein [Halomonas qijiaojingensis]GGY06920.1 hypothetical protein GCM10007160_37940 [Halomonas qijiaojingensis]